MSGSSGQTFLYIADQQLEGLYLTAIRSSFHTDYDYADRETKAKYVWPKYQPILKGCILDMGAYECYRRQTSHDS